MHKLATRCHVALYIIYHIYLNTTPLLNITPPFENINFFQNDQIFIKTKLLLPENDSNIKDDA